MVIDLSKQQALDGGPKAIQQISFTVNLSTSNNDRLMIFFIEETTETILDF